MAFNSSYSSYNTYNNINNNNRYYIPLKNTCNIDGTPTRPPPRICPSMSMDDSYSKMPIGLMNGTSVSPPPFGSYGSKTQKEVFKSPLCY